MQMCDWCMNGKGILPPQQGSKQGGVTWQPQLKCRSNALIPRPRGWSKPGWRLEMGCVQNAGTLGGDATLGTGCRTSAQWKPRQERQSPAGLSSFQDVRWWEEWESF